MEKDIEILDHEIKESKKRSQFLNVLCILTFIGSGLGILGAIWGLVPSNIQTGLDSMKQIQDNPNQIFSVGDFSKADYIKWSFYSNTGAIFTSIICLIGALLMYRLKKIGYFIYILGWLIQIAITIMSMPYLLTGDLAGFGTVTIAFNILVMIAFFVMYGFNFKHMK